MPTIRLAIFRMRLSVKLYGRERPKTLTEQEIENEQKHVKEKAMSDEIADPKAGYSGGEKVR